METEQSCIDNLSAVDSADIINTSVDSVGTGFDEEPDMWGLDVQPLEVLHHIFKYVNIQDVANLSRTCHRIHGYIVNDDILWKAHYLKLFDEPIQAPASWRETVRDLLSLRNFLKTGDRLAKEASLEKVANIAFDMLTKTTTTNPNKNQEFLASLMAMRTNESCFLSRSSLFRRAGRTWDEPADTQHLRQLSAKFHVYYGKEIELDEMDLLEDGAQEIHPYARTRVYDLRRYTRQNFWGPFMDDGSGKVDWEKVQSIMVVLAYGLREFSKRFNGTVGFLRDQPFHGLSTDSFHGFSLGCGRDEEQEEFGTRDPYNIAGTWMRVVNFLDYHDLFAFNFQPPFPAADQERPPISNKEAIRLILLKLKVTKIEGPQEDDDPSMPRVHFKGSSKSLTSAWDQNANSGISGYVRKTIHGDIRWTTFSVFGGEERWRSESVQIGGRNSARGAIGNWFDKNYDIHGPAGPTAFWKVSNDIVRPQKASAGDHIPHLQVMIGDSDDEDNDNEETESADDEEGHSSDDEDDEDDVDANNGWETEQTIPNGQVQL